jgi:arylsulfatase A-like enzyme
LFVLFGSLLRIWFLAGGASNYSSDLGGIAIWCIFLGLFRDALLAGLLGSPLLLGFLTDGRESTWRSLAVMVAVLQTAALIVLQIDVEFMRFYQVHMNAYVASYLRELRPLSGSILSLLRPWEWVVVALIPLLFVAAQVVVLRRSRFWPIDLGRTARWLTVAGVCMAVLIGLYNYKLTRWFTRENLAYQLSDNGILYLIGTLRDPKYTAPPVPEAERFAVARDLVREELGVLPLEAQSEQPWYWLSDEYAWVRGTGHHACNLGLADELGLSCSEDADGDGVSLARDCDDTRSWVFPGAADQPLNLDDEDCDGIDVARPNVVLVILESQRGVNVGNFRDLGAFPESATPFLDELATRGVLYQNFYSSGVTSARAILATLCGTYPHVGAMLLRDYNYLSLPSLADLLGEFGYSSAYMHSGDARFDNKRRWLQSWFDEIHDVSGTFADAERLTSWGVADDVMFDHSLDWADAQGDRPFFLVAVTVANHHPFQPQTTFDSPYAGAHDTYRRFLNTMAYQDAVLGDFMRAAQTRDWYDETYFIVTSDTGQVMGERGVFNDLGGLPPFEPSMWIPLLIMGPGIEAGHSSSLARQVASQVDIAPTVLDLLGIRRPHAFAGRSLLVELPYDDSVALMSNPYRDIWLAVRRGDLKTIHGRESDTTWSFDMSSDRREERDLVASGAHDPDQEIRLLEAWVDLQEFLVFHDRLWDPQQFAWRSSRR